ncbi:F0F1 ATP synthase subunit gamma [Microbacterium esteraromaticum]|uniref:F0F1 ATP synthase subunit gamma n=1 Tax=Mycoplasma wenyonii TaxID=65123 RepID=A0A328PVE1_9MOLU|nr:F0F1 ATP synthase subunit gamma [Mycoplasma wenyonii]PYC99661.1 F0F1 ATP synthase subunit gamma [Microbacterium esteraromaticum]RAO95079.1 F0F1 ATP synthase subunit gamma [Mycoplasma wenyonii]
MSTATLLIAKKIKDMQFILKVTEALKLISSAKLRNYKQIAQKSQDYCNSIKFLFEKFYSSYEHDYQLTNTKFFLAEQINPKLVLLVVIGTDLALCGRFNKQLIDHIRNNFSSHLHLVVFGRKLTALLSNTPLKEKIIKSYGSELPAKEFSKQIEEISAFLLKEYVNRGCQYLQILHKSLNKPFKLKKLLPFTEDYFGRVTRSIKYETHEYKVNTSDCVIEMFPTFFERTLQLSLIESKIAEHNLRRDVMSNAVKAAEEKLQEYQILYRKMKQSSITQEISEITAAIKCKN